MLSTPPRYDGPEPLPKELSGLESLAATLVSYFADGALRRELHPPARPEAPVSCGSRVAGADCWAPAPGASPGGHAWL
ncbi:hypothetical protein ACFYXM_27855 [Streptomyces sp. NPDC002476]|uniref:hypothetical protein n=1 Tax=Streptomyces sp. NPDC002476 TaxID=3364648 RepID=UPI00368DAF9E